MIKRNNLRQKLAKMLDEYAGPVICGIALAAPFVFQVNVPFALGMVFVGIGLIGLTIAFSGIEVVDEK